MTPTIGFVLLTHNKPHQILRLISTLNHLFDHPPIACHHDFSKCNLPDNQITSKVNFVKPHLNTGWGKFAIVDGVLLALNLMYKKDNSPDWFILMSGADYPIKPASQILNDLASSPYDVHIRHEEISYDAPQRSWQELCYQRYCTRRFKIPWMNRKFKFTKRELNLKHPFLTTPFVPFSPKLRCFAGEHWFCANRKAAEYLLNFYRSHPKLAAHYRSLDRYSVVPEESYYQTVFCNSDSLNISQNHWRYIDWSEGGFHPKTLRKEDIDAIRTSPAHFARKFDVDIDSDVLDLIDSEILDS
jgi:hypothetical protein